jgi:uncharacterized membrane protein
LQWINIAILLGICLTPFPNALLADSLRNGLFSGAAKAAAAAYNLVFLLATIPWIFFWDRLARHPDLLKPQHSAAWASRERLRGMFGVIVYTGGIPLALITPLGALALFIGSAVFFAITAKGDHLTRPAIASPGAPSTEQTDRSS